MDVLLIEDDVIIRDVLAEVLDDAGLAVTGLPDGEALFGEPQPDDGPRVVVTDVDLGAGCHNGLEVAERARRCWPGVGIVFITGRPSNLDGYALGRRDRFLPKPFVAAALLQAVSGLMQPNA